MRKILSTTLLLAAALCARADSLDAILARMDANASKFHSATAELKTTEYNELMKDSDPPSFGVLRIRRDKNGVAAITEYSKPEVHSELLKDKQAQVYHPKANLVQVYPLAKYNSSIDQFALLAFGSSGADLRKNYEVKVGGFEAIGSIPTTRLELIPKSEEVKKLFSKFELWIPDGQANAIREKVTAPSGDYHLIEYSNVKMNPNLKDSDFDLKLPPGVQKKNMSH